MHTTMVRQRKTATAMCILLTLTVNVLLFFLLVVSKVVCCFMRTDKCSAYREYSGIVAQRPLDDERRQPLQAAQAEA